MPTRRGVPTAPLPRSPRHRPLELLEKAALPLSKADTTVRGNCRNSGVSDPDASLELLTRLWRTDAPLHLRHPTVSGRRDRALDSLQHAWREHRANDEGRWSEVVRRDVVRQLNGQRRQHRPVGPYAGRNRLDLAGRIWRSRAEDDADHVASSVLDHDDLARSEIAQLVGNAVCEGLPAGRSYGIDRDLDVARGCSCGLVQNVMRRDSGCRACSLRMISSISSAVSCALSV